jgi:hypothetical protein
VEPRDGIHNDGVLPHPFPLAPHIRQCGRTLDTQCHDRVDYVVVVLLEGLDGLLAADRRLGHDEFDILVLDALGVDLLVVILLLLGSLLAVAVVVAGVVVVVRGGVGELLGSGSLGAGVEVLDLGLTEDAVTLLVPPLQLPCQEIHSGDGADSYM